MSAVDDPIVGSARATLPAVHRLETELSTEHSPTQRMNLPTDRPGQALRRRSSCSEEIPEPDFQRMIDIAERAPVTLLLAAATSVRTSFSRPGLAPASDPQRFGP
jgi:hypothetical protein